MAFADQFAKIANGYFAHVAANPGWHAAWSGVIAFGMQIYFDFSGYTDMAIGMAKPWGRSAFLQRDSILPGVSLPSRVVRSVIDTAVFRPQTFAAFLTLRVVNFATRSSTPTWSTAPTSSRSRAWAAWELRGSIPAISPRPPRKTIEKQPPRGAS